MGSMHLTPHIKACFPNGAKTPLFVAWNPCLDQTSRLGKSKNKHPGCPKKQSTFLVNPAANQPAFGMGCYRIFAPGETVPGNGKCMKLNSVINGSTSPTWQNTQVAAKKKSPIGTFDSLPCNHGLTRIWIHHGYIQQTTTSPLPEKGCSRDAGRVSILKCRCSQLCVDFGCQKI